MGTKQLENGADDHAYEFEDAVCQTGFGKYNIMLLVVCGVSLMSVIMETLSMSFILPAAQCDLELSLVDKGTLSSVGFLGVVISSLVWGFLGDTTGRRNVVLISSYISFIANIASSLSPYTWLLILLRFINCFFIGGPSAVAIAYLGEFHGLNYRARVITLSATFVAIASVILPSLAWLLLPMEWDLPMPYTVISWRPWRLLIILYGLPSFISATWLLFLPESPKYLWAMGRSEEAIDVLKKVYRVNTGKDESTFPVKKLVESNEVAKSADGKPINFKEMNVIVAFFKLMRQQLFPIFCPPLLVRICMTSLLQFGTFAASSGMLMWLPELLNKVALYSEQNNSTEVTVCEAMEYKNYIQVNTTNPMSGLNEEEVQCSDFIDTAVYKISLMIGAGSVAMFLFIGTVINLTGKKRLLGGILFTTGIAGVVTNFMQTYTLILLLCGIFIIGGAGVSILNTVAVDLFPTQYRSIAMAVALMAGRAGAMIASHVIGHLLEYNCSAVFYIFGGEYIFLGLFALLLPST